MYLSSHLTRSRWRWIRIKIKMMMKFNIKLLVFVISSYKNKTNKIWSLAFNCLYLQSSFMKKSSYVQSRRLLITLITLFDWSISKSIRKYCESNQASKTSRQNLRLRSMNERFASKHLVTSYTISYRFFSRKLIWTNFTWIS